MSSFQLVHQSNLVTTLTHVIPETTRTFHFWIFMLCVVFLFSFFYIEPTIFCVRCAWQMAKSGEFAWLQVHTGIARLFVCLFVRQVNKQRKKQHLRPNTAIAYTQLTLLRSKWGRSACIRCFHTQSRTHHSMPFLITRQVHSSIWIQTLRTPRVNWWMYVHQTYLLYEALLNFSFTKFINIKFLHNPQVCSRSCLCDAQISLKVITWAPQWKVGENQGVLHSQCPTSLLSRIFSIFHLKEMPVIPQRHHPPSFFHLISFPPNSNNIYLQTKPEWVS